MNPMIRNALVALALLAGAFAGGFYAGKGQREIQVQEKVVFKEGETKIVYQDRIVFKDRIVTVEKITKPDGTVVERTKTEDKDKTEEKSKEKTKKETETIAQKKSDIKPVLSNYSIGISAVKRWDDDLLRYPDYGVSAGRRIIDEFWLKGTVVPSQKEIQLGIEWQF